MAKEIEEIEPIEEVGEPEKGSFYAESEGWFEDNKQKLAIGGGALLVLIVAVVFIFAKWLPDRNLKASREMFMAEAAFGKDSFDVALNGNLQFKGFLEIKKKYSFTKLL